jgi:hypothetical protein
MAVIVVISHTALGVPLTGGAPDPGAAGASGVGRGKMGDDRQALAISGSERGGLIGGAPADLNKF